MASEGSGSESQVLGLGPRLERVLEIAYRARRPVLLEGSTGIGKSEIVAQTAVQLGVGFRVLDLSLLEPPDLVGLPLVQGGRTSYALPSALPADGAGILLLEELNRAERYIQQPALQLLTARQLHEYRLPDGWVCFAAINPEHGEYQVTPLDPAMRARFLRLEVRPDRAAWILWGLEHRLHPAVLELARAQDRIFADVPPRTWTYVSQLLQAMRGEERSDPQLLRDLLAGYLPTAWAVLLIKGLAGFRMNLDLDARALLGTYVKGGPQAAILRGYREQGRTDCVDELVQQLFSIVSGPEAGALAASGGLTLDAFEALLADLPGDQRERLQEALGGNSTAVGLLGTRPAALLQEYATGSLARKLDAWAADPHRRHRVLLFVTALRSWLEHGADVAALRRNNALRSALGRLLAGLGPGPAQGLVQTLQKLQLQPLPPRR